MHKLIIIAAVAVLGATNGASATRVSGAGGGLEVPRAWAPADSADSLWRQGRNAISDEDWRLAQKLFAQIHDRYPKSAYAADSFYWEAFALSRRGGFGNIRDAVSLLERQMERFANASSVKSGDSKSLLTRLQGALARGGDASAAAEISARAGSASARSSGNAGGGSSRAGARASRGSSSSAEGCKSEDDDDRGAERIAADGIRRCTADPEEGARAT